MPISLEDDGRVERRRVQPAMATTVALASSFECLREEIAQLRLLDAWLHHLHHQVRASIAACESGALPTDMLSGVALLKLEIDLFTLERQLDALVQSHYHRLRCVECGRH